MLKSTEGTFHDKNISSSLNMMMKASDCNMILLKRFLVQFYIKGGGGGGGGGFRPFTLEKMISSAIPPMRGLGAKTGAKTRI